MLFTLLKFQLLFVFSFSLAFANEFLIIKKRFVDDLALNLEEDVSKQIVKDSPLWAKSITTKGVWSDIRYDLDDNQFSPGEHLRRMDFMSRSYMSKDAHSTFKNPQLKEAILRSFDYWVSVDIQSYNWWNNEIGTPQRFARTMLLMETELGKNRIAAGIKFLEKAEIKKTGQNRLWYTELVLTRGIFEENSKIVKLAVNELQKVLVINDNTQEGIQVDLSFHQHGKLIYNGGYGAKFSADMARLVSILAGTQYSFSKEKIKILSSYILDAQVWMTRGNKWDYSVTGREFVRLNKDAQLLLKTCKLLSKARIERSSEFKKCFDSLAHAKNYLSGNKFFWRSDYMLQQSPNFFTSLRMYSQRTMNNDAPSNGEGLLSHHMADGAMFVMNRGDEYEGIFPVWDWRRIPGTTTEVKTLKPAIYEPGNWDGFAHIRYFGSSSFVGGLSDQVSGLAAMDFVSNKNYEKLDAKKFWLFNSNEIIAKGNSIACEGCKEVVTTIEQKNQFGKVYILTRSGELTEHQGAKRYEDILGVYHDQTAYIFPDKQTIRVSAVKQSGSWRKINQQLSNNIVEKDVFSLWIEHRIRGKDVSSDYSYKIIPGMSLESFRNMDLKHSESVNSSELIALENDQKIYASVFKEGSYYFSGQKVKTAHPCVLIMNLKTKKLLVSDPTQKIKEFKLEINNKSYTIPAPLGSKSGSSVEIHL